MAALAELSQDVSGYASYPGISLWYLKILYLYLEILESILGYLSICEIFRFYNVRPPTDSVQLVYNLVN